MVVKVDHNEDKGEIDINNDKEYLLLKNKHSVVEDTVSWELARWPGRVLYSVACKWSPLPTDYPEKLLTPTQKNRFFIYRK